MYKFFRTRIFALLVLAVSALVTMNSSPAEAQTIDCTVTAVAWATSDGGTLQVFCSGTGYWAFGTHLTCPTVDPDTRRAWLSLAQGALLSGKKLTLSKVECENGPAITYMVLKK